jgi:hypothetical protein
MEGEVPPICWIVVHDGPERAFQSPIHDFGACPSSSSHFDLERDRHLTGRGGYKLASRALLLGFFGMHLHRLAHPVHRE